MLEDKIIGMVKKISKENVSIDISTDLLESASLDSLGIANLINMLESEYQIELSAEDIIPENFSTVTAISEMTRRYIDSSQSQ